MPSSTVNEGYTNFHKDLVEGKRKGWMTYFQHWFKRPSATELMTLEIKKDRSNDPRNLLYEALEIYLRDKISPSTRPLKISENRNGNKFSIHFLNNQKFQDVYEEIQLQWKFRSSNKSFKLRFDAKHQKKVIEGYLPYVVETFKNKDLFISRLSHKLAWTSIYLKHSATFKNLAMDPDQKRSILEDLDRFVKEKEFFQRVGRVWRRVYLIYGPPGTGKSSLVAAIANYLHYHIYDLQLTQLKSNTQLRSVVKQLGKKSIILVENINLRILKSQDRKDSSTKNVSEGIDQQLLVSELLNLTEGLNSASGEEKIIIFTTNHEKKLDPALLRMLSGRLDMHIHMSYCSFKGFKTLASTYLGINEHQPLFDEIETLLQDTKVTPAQISQELMKSKDADVAVLQNLITMLKETRNKRMDEYQNEDDEVDSEKNLTYFI